MAEDSYSIDKLSLDIDIKLKNAQTKSVENLTSAIVALNKAVSNVAGLTNYISALNKLKLPKVSNGRTVTSKKQDDKLKPQATFTEVGKVTNEVSSSMKVLKDGTIQVNKVMEETLDNGQKIRTTLTDEKIVSQTTKLGNKIEKVAKETKNVDKEAEKTSKTFNKLIRSVGRIAFYRAIRTALKETVDAFKEGVANIRQVDSGLDTSLKRISASATTIKNSFVSLFTGLIERVEPVITKIADGIATIVNQINEAKAALSGAETYTRILTSDTEEWQKQLEKVEGSLFSFDKFESLTKKKNGYAGVVEETVSMDTNKAQSIVGVLNAIKASILGIVGAVITLKALKGIDYILRTTKALEGLRLSTKLVWAGGIMLLITGILDFISAMKSMSSEMKILIPVVAGLAGVITSLVLGLTILKGNWGLAFGIGAMVTGAGLLVMSELKKANVMAEGGVPKTGSAFIAGEAGAELVYDMPSGKTGVSNVQQLEQAVANALERRTNPLLSAIYSEVDGGVATSGNFSLTQFVNAIMPEVDAYNKRRGVRV